MKLILAMTQYARDRHTPEGPLSHYTGTSVGILDLVRENWENRKPGFRDGVVTVEVPPANFFSGVVILKEGDELEGVFESRRKLPCGKPESPRKAVRAKGASKIEAQSVHIVMFQSLVLGQDAEMKFDVTENHWEVVSINASPLKGGEPIHPDTLIANHFGLEGGTPTGMTPEQFECQLEMSVLYWKDKAMAGGVG